MKMQWHKVSYSSQDETKPIKDLKKNPCNKETSKPYFLPNFFYILHFGGAITST